MIVQAGCCFLLFLVMVMPRYWCYHVSLACEKKDVSNPKGWPPSAERTGPPSQGSQTINS